MDWQEVAGNWVLTPRRPIGIVHFLGGAFAAPAPQLTYRWLLEALAQKRYLVVATPFVQTLDHNEIALEVLKAFETTTERLKKSATLSKAYLPIYGVGHSLGSKLHLLIGSLFEVSRAGNILMCYNNHSARRAIPLVEQLNLTPAFNIEFTPTPVKTNQLIAQEYSIRRNLLIKFQNDDIDQTTSLMNLLQKRFGNMVASLTLPGTHITPLGQDVNWQAGREFTPLDAVGQWVKQEFLYKDLNQLLREMSRWLNPVLPV
ncbi:MAG: DUF1350 family protein [Hormoscilla sp. GM7CHS1pb]|nr:DUF1350 family protein [Hormoscilla sp. GM7CHS1pb]